MMTGAHLRWTVGPGPRRSICTASIQWVHDVKLRVKYGEEMNWTPYLTMPSLKMVPF